MAAALIWVQSVPTFGTTVVIPFGLEGHLYLLKSGTAQLPNFNALEPVVHLRQIAEHRASGIDNGRIHPPQRKTR